MTDQTLNSEAEPTEAEPSPEATVDDAMGSAYDKLMRDHGAERGPDGKFRSPKAEAEEPEEEPEAKPEEPEEAEEVEEPEEEPEEEEEGVSKPPEHLPQAIKAAWKDLPEDTRGAIAKHQQEIDRKFSEQGRRLQALEPISQRLMSAIQEDPDLLNQTPEEVAEGAIRLRKVERELTQDPVNTVLRVAQEYGVLDHLRAYMSGQQPTDQQNYIAQMHQELRALREQIAKGSDPSAIEQRISAAMNERETASVVNDFAANQPHWGDVEPYLPQFIAIAREQAPGAPPGDILKAAYDMATNAIPEVRAKIAKGADKAPKADPERAAKAKRASSVNLKSTSTGKERAKSEEELLGDAYDRLMAG